MFQARTPAAPSMRGRTDQSIRALQYCSFFGLFHSIGLMPYSSSEPLILFMSLRRGGFLKARRDKNRRIYIPHVGPSMGNGKENKQNPVTISAIFQQRQCQCMSKTIGSGNFADLPLASRFFADDPPMTDHHFARADKTAGI